MHGVIVHGQSRLKSCETPVVFQTTPPPSDHLDLAGWLAGMVT